MEDKLNIATRKYLERELRDYIKNKKCIEELRLDIIESSPSPDLGQPRSSTRGNEQLTNKVYRLMSNTKINRLEATTEAIYKVLTGLDDNHYTFYVMFFQKGCNRTKVCYDMPISEATFNRYKNKIVEDLAKELGYL